MSESLAIADRITNDIEGVDREGNSSDRRLGPNTLQMDKEPSGIPVASRIRMGRTMKETGD